MYAPLPFMGDGANCTHTMIIRRLIRRILLFMGMMAIILLAITIGGSFYMLDISLGDLSGKDLQVRRDQLLQESPDVVAWADSLKNIGMMRDTFMTTADGRRLHANYFFANDSTTRTMVVSSPTWPPLSPPSACRPRQNTPPARCTAYGSRNPRRERAHDRKSRERRLPR